jgi:DNA-binding transcriptional LysR family regulator
MARSFDGIALGSIELFLKAAETESFAAAAVALGLSPPAVSRAVARLEARLGVRLFQRTTRKVSLTGDGRLYFHECREALGQIAAAEDVLAGRQRDPSGLLRISVPTTYAHFRLLQIVPAFRERYPRVNLAINVSNRNADLIEEGYDLAIRLGDPADSRLVARKLEDATLGIFASPAYLAQREEPRTIGDLKQHTLVAFERPSTGKTMPWLLREGENAVEFNVEAGVSCSDDVLGCVSLARAGAGLFQIYHFVAAEAVREGELVEVLHHYAGASRRFSILYPQNRHLSARVRVFVEFLLDAVARKG